MNVNKCNDYTKHELGEPRSHYFKEHDSQEPEVATTVLGSQPRPAGGWNAPLIAALGF